MKMTPEDIEHILALNARDKDIRALGLYHINVYHDEWCSIFRGGDCTCEPAVVVRGRLADEIEKGLLH